MKFLVAVTLLIVGAWANPQQRAAARDSSIVDALVNRIEDLSLRIKERGFDPMHIPKESWYNELPVPEIGRLGCVIENLDFRGLSNIVINDCTFNPATGAVYFDLEIPYIRGSIEHGLCEANLFAKPYDAQLFGSFDIGKISAKGTVYISAGGSGITANTADVQTNIASMRSSITATIGDIDLSDRINGLINTRLPEAFANFDAEINELVGIYLVRYINRPQEE